MCHAYMGWVLACCFQIGVKEQLCSCLYVVYHCRACSLYVCQNVREYNWSGDLARMGPETAAQALPSSKPEKITSTSSRHRQMPAALQGQSIRHNEGGTGFPHLCAGRKRTATNWESVFIIRLCRCNQQVKLISNLIE